MDFSIMAEAYERMTQTSSRTELTTILVEVLKKTPPSLISHVAYLTQGKLYPDFEGIELGMAEKTVEKAIEKAYGADHSKVVELMRKTGDLGDVASILCEKRVQQAFFTETLTVEKVYSTFDEIARTSGPGTTQIKINKLASLLNSATKIEARFLTRFVSGKLRLGVADFTVLDALAIAFTEDKSNRDKLENAYNLTSDLGYVAKLIATSGLKAIQRVKVTPGKPVRPMLAERLETTQKIIEQMNHDAASEYKLDGERIQAHRTPDGKITLFSRRLEKITSHYPDVVEVLKTLPAEDFIIEGEVVAVDRSGRYLPFQELMHRRRKYELVDAMKKYPVSVNLFDVLYLEGEGYIEQPYAKRREALETLYRKGKAMDKQKIQLVPAERVTTARKIDSVMKEALTAGCEGVVVKDPYSPYKAGARGFAWVKFKPEYRPSVRDTLDLVIVGANHGMGRRAGVYGAFLLAAYDKQADVFRTTTKVGTGFTDLDLENLTKLLKQHKISEKSARVDAKVVAEDWFEPAIVIEVIASEITLSPIYTAGLDVIREGSGFALRFPKYTGKLRSDKSPEDASTVQELLEMYLRQTRQYKGEAKASA